MRRLVFFLILVLILIGVVSTTHLYEDWLWFKDLGYSQLFWTPLLTKLGVQAVNGAFLLVMIFATLMALRNSLVILINDRFQRQIRVIREHDMAPVAETLDSRLVTVAMFLVSLLISYGISFVSGSAGWMDFLNFKNATSFNVADPAFGKDLSFYFFLLPFYQIVYQAFYLPLLFLSVASIVLYLLTGMISIKSIALWRKHAIVIQRPAQRHLAVFGVLLFILKAFDYVLNIFELVYSQHGHVFGAGFTDLTTTAPALKVLVVLSIIGCLAALFALFFRDARLLTLPLAGTVLFSIVGYGLLPAAVQSLVVIPNELDKEMPYISNEISFTKYAFSLDKIKTISYPGTTPLNANVLAQNRGTVQNIRINDPGPMSLTYAQKQGIRLYYKFSNIDMDRYHLNGQLRQVLLAPRELSSQDIDPKAQTFINLRFKYTHGYGVAASLANEVTSEGLPSFIIKDVPPVSNYSALNITEPRIYFGEKTNDWVVTKTSAKEFDYPQGSNNAENTYHGSTGIALTGLNKLMLSLNHATLRFYLASEITPDSKILLTRNIIDRARKLAPFLTYDSDPYMVISHGRLFWMIDAYTTSEYMPYANPQSDTGVNYIRNSVKVVVDAYNGSVNFYIADRTDPLILTYSKTFPGVFKDIDQMPADLRSHIRYPEDLFTIQSNILKNFHMDNPTVFYNKEDAWDVPAELHDNSQADDMKPYYSVMRLPGEKQEEYVLMIPFTPASSQTNKRNNMVAWLGARMDGENFGQLVLYQLPKNIEIDGPFQIESRIDQDTEISKQLSLWDQRGSSVIRGNTLTLPIGGNFLYVEPIYLQSDKSAIPEMKRVVVVYADQIVMADSLNSALTTIFGPGAVPNGTPVIPTPARPGRPAAPGTNVTAPQSSQEQIQALVNQIDEMKQMLDDLQNKLESLSGSAADSSR